MRWLVGWSSTPVNPGPSAGDEGPAVLPVGAQPLWEGPDPLWAVGDWRPDEVRLVQVERDTRMAVFGVCGATDDQLKVGLLAARGGALRHLTAWSGSYTAVAQVGRRVTVTGDLAGARPVFHTPWAGGTAYATAALPLADLVEAGLDVGYLAALLACPDAPEALGDDTPYTDVRRVPPGHALVLRGGTREITSYEPSTSLAVAAPQVAPEQAVDGVREALVEAVRARFAGPRHAPAGAHPASAHEGRAQGAYESLAHDAHPRDAHRGHAQCHLTGEPGEPGGPGGSGGHGPDGVDEDSPRYAASNAAGPGTSTAFPQDTPAQGLSAHGASAHGASARSDAGHGRGPGADGSVYGARPGGDGGSMCANGGPGGGGGSVYGSGGSRAEGGSGAGAHDGRRTGPGAFRDHGYDGSAYGDRQSRPYGPGHRDPGPVPGMGPADRRAARGAPAPGIGADLSGGSASGTLALLAAGLPGLPGTLGRNGRRLLAVTFNDLATPSGREHREAELERARALAADPRLHHVVVTAGEEALPFADMEAGPLTDEPGPSLVSALRHRVRLLAGSADHLVGLGAREALDAHPARLADLLLDRHRRHLLRPVTALATADGTSAQSILVPFTVYRAARRLARTPYRAGVAETAGRLRDGHGIDVPPGDDTAVTASLAALSWCRTGPAARWLTGEALAEVSVRLTAGAERTATALRPGDRRARAALARHAADFRVLSQAAEIRDQRLHAPFLDNQVVLACRALPDTMRVRPGARADVLRTVLAGAGVHHLPNGWGTPSHLPRTAAERTGLRLAAADLLPFFDAPLLGDAGLVDTHAVRSTLQAVAEGRPLPLDGLAEVVATEVWLRRLLARRGTCWTERDTAAPRRRAVAHGIPALASPARLG